MDAHLHETKGSNMKRVGWVLIAGVLAVGAFTLMPAGAVPNEGVRKFMRPKLDHAQRVLEGLALEDSKMIGDNAKALLKLSEAAEWQVLPGPEYVQYSSDFQRICNQLIEAANHQNVDAATLAYVQLTMNCVNCHKHVRKVQRFADAK